MEKNKLKVFLSNTSNSEIPRRTFLYNVLKRAELEVFSIDENKEIPLNVFHEKVQSAIENADCSIHILGNEPEKKDNSTSSITEMQLIQAKKYSTTKQDEFRIFIWQPENSDKNQNNTDENSFITSVTNSILQNITISKQESAIGFVEDLYAVMNSQTKNIQKGNNTDIFFIHNELDEDPAAQIVELLEDIVSVEKLSMVQNSDRDYSNFIIEQAKHSKLIVVFFKWATNWAEPFLQQLWRLTGGASSTVQIIITADISYKEQLEKLFEMPNVSSYFVSEELIPLEIKVQFDRIVK